MTQQILHPQQKSVQELLSGCFGFSSSQIEYNKYNLKGSGQRDWWQPVWLAGAAPR
jgi:hypothetical protein